MGSCGIMAILSNQGILYIFVHFVVCEILYIHFTGMARIGHCAGKSFFDGKTNLSKYIVHRELQVRM